MVVSQVSLNSLASSAMLLPLEFYPPPEVHRGRLVARIPTVDHPLLAIEVMGLGQHHHYLCFGTVEQPSAGLIQSFDQWLDRQICVLISIYSDGTALLRGPSVDPLPLRQVVEPWRMADANDVRRFGSTSN
jgi:hypothetical protein